MHCLLIHTAKVSLPRKAPLRVEQPYEDGRYSLRNLLRYGLSQQDSRTDEAVRRSAIVRATYSILYPAGLDAPAPRSRRSGADVGLLSRHLLEDNQKTFVPEFG